MREPGTDPVFTEVPVAAGILHTTADLLDVLEDFLTGADPAIRAQLGSFLIGHRDITATKNPALAASIILADLHDAAELLHALADGTSPATSARRAPEG